MGDRLMNEGPKWLILVIWLLINFGMFVGFFMKFHTSTEYHYLGQLTGISLPFARGSAACLNFNCMLVMLPVCRNLISYLRGSCRCVKRNFRRQLDRSLEFHKLTAYAICFFTAIHYFAHTYNFEHLIDAWHQEESSLKTTLTLLPVTDNGTWVNPIRSSNTNPMYEVIKAVPGWTGVVITLALVLIVSSSVEVIRHYYYELFWFTHHLFIIFLIGLVTHGLGGVVRGQTNIDQHDPKHCADKDWRQTEECKVLPQFGAPGPQTWKWVLAPVLLYVVERVLRFYRSQKQFTINKVVMHPSKVMELQIKKGDFSAQAGQYVFLHCAQISRLEWHPFTLTSTPEDDSLAVHLRIVGDWTGDLAKACTTGAELPHLAIDGPFGTCSEDADRYQVVILIGAGIGVTPFASILKSLWYKYRKLQGNLKLQKIYFFWVCPSTSSFEWFAELLKDMEGEIMEAGVADFLSYNIYLTRGWDTDQAVNIVSHEEDEQDVITGLRQKTSYGRPHWDQVFPDIARTHTGVRIGTFFCGPKAMSKDLHTACNKYSSSDPKGVHFVYNKENF